MRAHRCGWEFLKIVTFRRVAPRDFQKIISCRFAAPRDLLKIITFVCHPR